MTTRLDPKIRLLLLALLLTAIGGLVVIAARRCEPTSASLETRNQALAEPKTHPKSSPTDFYDIPLVANPPNRQDIQFTSQQVSHDSILFVLILNEGDLLADYCLLTVREFIDEQQLHQARAVARRYDGQLKDLRRERAQILEQAGISIEDPSRHLAQLREKAFRLFTEVNQTIMKEVLSAKQRKQIYAKTQEFRAAKKTAAEKPGSVATADNGNRTN